MAVSERAVCFDCEQDIDRMDEIVFAPPFEDISDRRVTACFHALCLMRWRERRAEVRTRMQDIHQAFLRHVAGDCGCQE